MNRNFEPLIQLKILLLLFVLSLGIVGCKNKSSVVSMTEPLNNKSEKFLLEKLRQSSFSFDFFQAKASVDFKSNDQAQSFKINIRIKKDSAIWISITPALGIEVARALITKDSIKFIDKINNKYLADKITKIELLLNAELDYSTIENALMGNAIQIYEEDKFKSSTEDPNYLLLSKNKRKVRRAVGIRKNEAAEFVSDSAFYENIKDKKFKKASDKFEDEEMMIKRYWMDGVNYKIRKTILDDLILQRVITLEYSEFEKLNDLLFPNKAMFSVATKTSTASFNIEYSKVSINEPTGMPFKIPEKFDPFKP
jgi:Domain of unknown function (DUF4292)